MDTHFDVLVPSDMQPVLGILLCWLVDWFIVELFDELILFGWWLQVLGAWLAVELPKNHDTLSIRGSHFQPIFQKISRGRVQKPISTLLHMYNRKTRKQLWREALRPCEDTSLLHDSTGRVVKFWNQTLLS